jgi:hypothetical protein
VLRVARSADLLEASPCLLLGELENFVNNSRPNRRMKNVNRNAIEIRRIKGPEEDAPAR